MLDRTSIYYRQVQLLISVLPYVAEEESFALKGGTAINMFIRDMPRLSVDIDLAYLPIEDRDTSLTHIAEAFTRIAERVERGIRGSKVHRIGQHEDETLSKLQVERSGVRIKIETSPVMRGTLYEADTRKVSDAVEEEFGFVECQIVHMNDLYAGKMCAALDRQHPRDLFDIRNLLDNEGIDSELMNAFIVYLVSSNQSIAKLLQPNFHDMREIYERQFSGMTITPVSLEMLLRTREEFLEIIHKKMTMEHKEFLMGFKRGEPRWDLLPFERVEYLPSVRWKMLNLDKMPPEKRAEAVAKLSTILQTG